MIMPVAYIHVMILWGGMPLGDIDVGGSSLSGYGNKVRASGALGLGVGAGSLFWSESVSGRTGKMERIEIRL